MSGDLLRSLVSVALADRSCFLSQSEGTDLRAADYGDPSSPKISQLICVPVSSQIERRPDAFGSVVPRIHLRRAPSVPLIAPAVAETLP